MNLAEELRAAVASVAQPRFDWVHPSWRDVVIEHLMKHPGARRRFLSRCGVDGLALALSVSGGRAGERSLPLLQRSDDWGVTRVRAVELIPTLGDQEQRRLLAGLRGLSRSVKEPSLESEANQLQREVLEALVADWNASAKVIARASLELFYKVSLEVRPLVAGPHLEATWAALAPGLIEFEPPELDVDSVLEQEFDTYLLERAMDFLTIVAANEPRFLQQIGWPDSFRTTTGAAYQMLEAFASEADAALEDLGTQGIPVDPEEFSVDANRLAGLAEHLDHLGIGGAASLRDGIRGAERRVDEWLERRAQEQAEDEDIVGDIEDEPDDEGDPAAFDINALFEDL
jgi:hypothetical protein